MLSSSKEKQKTIIATSGPCNLTRKSENRIYEHKKNKKDTIEKDLRYQKCYHCHNDRFINVMPCLGCKTGNLISIKELTQKSQAMYHNKYD